MASSSRQQVRALAIALLACGSCQQGGAVVAGTSSGGASSSGTGASSGSAGSTGATGDASGGSASSGGGTTHHGGGGSSSGGSGSESGTTGDPGTPPAPARWVLYDADEVAVDAVVAPSCVGDHPTCNMPEPGHRGAVSPQCVRVIWHEGSYVDLLYGSETGLLDECRTGPLWDAEHPPGAFPGADCAPPAYFPAGEGTSNGYRWERAIKAFADGRFEYESRDTPAMGFYPANSWLGNECVVNILLSGGTPWLPVPDWAVGLLPNPPYSLRWEPWE